MKTKICDSCSWASKMLGYRIECAFCNPRRDNE